MTREEISKRIQSNQRVDSSTRAWCESLINDVVSDFESRTCENCSHYYQPELTTNINKCKLGFVSMFCGGAIRDGEVDSDFGCNRWEER